MTFNPQSTHTKLETSGDFTRPVLYSTKLRKLLRSRKRKTTTTIKKTQTHRKNHFIPENTLFFTQSLNTPSPNSLPPTHFTNKFIACPEDLFIVTPSPL